MMNPDPEPARLSRSRVPRSTRTWATAGATSATTLLTACEYASRISASASRESGPAGTGMSELSAVKGAAASLRREDAIAGQMVADAYAFKDGLPIRTPGAPFVSRDRR